MRLTKFALSAVLAAVAAAGTVPAPASANLIFTGSVSGSYDQRWQVANPDDSCVSGGGEQAVQFTAVPPLRIAGGINGDGGNPRSDGRPWEFGPFKIKGTVARTDNTVALSGPGCFEQQPLPPHDCGGPRSFTLGGVYIYKGKGARRATFHLELDNLDTKIAQLFADAKQCFAPDVSTYSRGFTAAWPGDRRMAKLHRIFTFSGSEPFASRRNDPDYLPAGPSVNLNSATTFAWKAVLRSKCYLGNLYGPPKCQ